MPDPASTPPDRPRETDPAPAKPHDHTALLRAANIGLHILLPTLVVFLVWHEVSHIHFRQVRELAKAADPRLLLLSIACAALALSAMGCYDILAFPSTPRLRPRARW